MSRRTTSPPRPREASLLKAKGSGPLRIALAFPSTYYVGMSNLGYQAVFRMLADMPEVSCERVFLPDAAALAGLRRTGRPLCSFETGASLDTFHVIAFSLSFENDYENILAMLSLGRVPLLQAARNVRSPLVIGGGVAAFLNPEPLADFFDLFLLGEAEEALEPLCGEALRQLRDTKACRDLGAYKDMEGVYIPSAYAVRYSDDGCPAARDCLPGYPAAIACRQAAHVDRFATASCFLSPDTEFSDMGIIEVSRGCSRRCRFCAVGSVYHPYRPRSREAVFAAAAELLERRKKIGLMAAAVSDFPGLPGLVRALADRGARVSVSSLRADALTDEVVSLLQGCGHKTFTIACEAGSERLRRVIGKGLTHGQIEEAARVLSRCRAPGIKLYFMIGLPTETDPDIAAIVDLVRHIKHTYYKEARAEKWLRSIQVSVSPFVPKPWTPFQWAAFEDVGSLKRKLKRITSGLRGERKVMVSCDLPKWGYIQALLSRGDRRVGKLLHKVFELGGDWNRAFRECDLNPDFYVCRQRGEQEVFPWDFIRHRVDKARLLHEWRGAFS